MTDQGMRLSGKKLTGRVTEIDTLKASCKIQI